MTRSCLSHRNFPLNRSFSTYRYSNQRYWIFRNPRYANIPLMICLSALKYNLTSCLPLSFVQKSYSYILLPLLVVTIITCYCAWSVTFGWSSTSNISGQLQRYKILPGKLKVQWNHWNGSVGHSWHNLFYKTVRAEAQEPGSEISSTGNSSLSSESAFFFSKTRRVILKILKWLMSDFKSSYP